MRIARMFDAERVATRIEELSRALAEDYRDGALSILGIAEGSARFVDGLVAGLERHGLAPVVHMVRAHRTDGTALNSVELGPVALEALNERDVLVCDDIADEGKTLRAVLDLVEGAGAHSVHTAVLIDKHGAEREDLPLDYVGFTVGPFQVEPGWVVGFGMDLDGRFRELDWIGVVEDD